MTSCAFRCPMVEVEGTFVTFSGLRPHRIVINAWHVDLIGPFDMESGNGVGVSSDLVHHTYSRCNLDWIHSFVSEGHLILIMTVPVFLSYCRMWVQVAVFRCVQSYILIGFILLYLKGIYLIDSLCLSFILQAVSPSCCVSLCKVSYLDWIHSFVFCCWSWRTYLVLTVSLSPHLLLTFDILCFESGTPSKSDRKSLCSTVK